LKKISDIESTKDLDVLTLYLQVCPEKSFSKNVEIIDRILASNPPPGILLQYQTLKGVQYYLLKDSDSAKSIVATAIEKFKSEGIDNPSTYDLGMLAQSLYILGEISGNKTCFVESQSYFKKILESPDIKPSGTALIYSNLGHSLLSEGKPAEAKEYFMKSLEINDAEITKVFMGRAWLNLQDFEKAKDVLSKIKTDKMDEREQYDYAITWTILALATRNMELLAKANIMLTATISEGPLFSELKNNLLSEVQHVMKTDEGGLVPKILRLLSRYILLQPNVIGLGVNINNILDDAGRRSGKKKNL
jgi:tetratricopeptide (TPR) repeat protein